MTLDELRASSGDAILATAARHGVVRLLVFGSFARGDARPDSDLDLLIGRAPHRTPFFPGGLIADLEDLIGRKIDVVTINALPATIRDTVLHEAVPF